jgi:hypothetical protein
MKNNAVLATLCWIVCFGSAAGLCGTPGNQASALAADSSWTRVTEHAAFQARDSAGEMVYDGKMWYMGGWFNSDPGPFPNDVWSSTNGADWTCVTPSAAWTPVDIPVTMVFDDKMWLMSGWYGGRTAGAHGSNEVWCSTNGADWIETTTGVPWTARLGAAGAVCNGKMWIMGGTTAPTGGGTLLNDVWSSSDGITWDQATAHAPWSSRAYHQVLSFDNKLWVLGGGNYLSHYWSSNEVWNSSDGVNWTKVANAPWDPRTFFSAEVYDGRMWIMGGSGDSSDRADLLNDVWSSTDGVNWTELEADNVWCGRHEMSSYVFQDKLWVVGGYASQPFAVANDVWQINAAAPEPGPLVLLGTALAGLLVYLWCRRR